MTSDGNEKQTTQVYTPLITHDGQVLGCLVADILKSESGWDAVEVQVLRLVSAFISRTIESRLLEYEMTRKHTLMQTMIDYLPHYMYAKNAQSEFLLVNKKLATENNVDHPEEMVGKSDFDYYRKDLAQKFFEDEQKIIKSGEPVLNLEEEGHDRHGNRCWVMTTKIPLKNDRGEVTALVGTGIDITEKKEAELRVLESEEQFRIITEAASDGILVHDSDGHLQYSNSAVESMFGYSHEELETLSMKQLLDDVHTPESNEQNMYTKIGRKKDGVLFPIEMSASSVKMKDQWLVVSIIRDVSRREEAMQETRKLTAAIEQSEDGFIIFDEKGIITYVNPGYEKITGYTKDEVIGKPWADVQGYGAVKHFPAGQSERKEKNWNVSQTATRRDGTTYEEDISTFPIYDDGGKICSYVTIIRDVSEERALESELRQAQKLESVGQLASGIAHEINTPVQFVGDNIQFIKEAINDLINLREVDDRLLEAVKQSAVSNELIKFVEKAVEEADLDYLKEELPLAIDQSVEGIKRVTSIVRAMKEFAHPGKKEKVPANLNEAIKTTVTVARNEWKYSCDLEMELDTNLPFVSCLVGEFNQVILNLIVNARDAIIEKQDGQGEKGHILISTQYTDKYVEVRVKDNGGGIPESIIERIFDPFFTTKAVGKGSGQGLAIARGVIVNKHNGEFNVESEEGSGTTFIIRLPLEESKSSA